MAHVLAVRQLYSQLHSVLLGKLIIIYVFPRALLNTTLEIRKHASAKQPTGYPVGNQQEEESEESKDFETVFTALTDSRKLDE